MPLLLGEHIFNFSASTFMILKIFSNGSENTPPSINERKSTNKAKI